MRLFLVGVLCVAWAGCSKGDDLKAGALSVKVAFSGFRPGCVQVRVTDQEDATRQTSTPVRVPPNQREGTLSVAVFRQAGWSRNVLVSAWAQELDCEGAKVAESGDAPVSIPEEGASPPVNLSLNATDFDDDGYVSQVNGGTDCDDRNLETTVTRTWFQDTDTDGYGAAPVMACVQPPRTATRSGDCKDDDARVHPEQGEFRCDDLDDNCDGQKDESLNLGSECSDAFACKGTRACDPTDAGFACTGRPAPTAWFVDEDGDGDGTVGKDGGVTCLPRPSGTSAFATDCDESSRFRSGNLAEVCDRMDNDCDGTADDNLASCDLTWQKPPTGSGAQPKWSAIATLGQERAWLAGPNSKVAELLEDGTLRPVTCDGDWKAAWVSASGEVFLAGAAGRLARALPTATDCTLTDLGNGQSFNGIVGFDATDGGTPTLYSATSNGRIYRWAPPALPEEVAAPGVNLKAIHGSTDPTTLIAVGRDDVAGIGLGPSAYRFNPDGGAWLNEQLPSVDNSVYLWGVHVVDSHYAYAVGDKGVALQRINGQWSKIPDVPVGGVNTSLQDVLAFGPTAVYVATTDGSILFYNGVGWSTAYPAPAASPPALRALDGRTPTRIGAAGDEGTTVFFKR
ncbi:putative metal-binding motif-containing protein [Corallococcus sp. CA053C]|uniref:putative metal-binding motif-containing protein n=1 Tax=Corallococcus sp. CA053C TaxID=2316732 RepID=UPI0011C3A275|nr:putative metal-binding motif-containing protein [Corallococcus sp. CA053C]